MKCEVCQRSPKQVPLFRVNEKGVLGRWRCKTHPPQAGECCCNYLLDVMCSYHQYALFTDADNLVESLKHDPYSWTGRGPDYEH